MDSSTIKLTAAIGIIIVVVILFIFIINKRRVQKVGEPAKESNEEKVSEENDAELDDLINSINSEQDDNLSSVDEVDY